MIQNRARVPAAILLTVALAVAAGHAQQPTPPQPAGTVSAGVTAVLVDVVVRDKRGESVRDLTQADFEVLEDGVPQSIGAFTRIFDGAAAAVAMPTPQAAADRATVAVGSAPPVNPGPAVTALVFHQLGPEGRRLAVQAAQRFIGTREETPSYIGIFGLDLALMPLVPFTRNGLAVRRGLARIAASGTASFNSAEQQEQKANADRQAATATATAMAAQAVGGPAGGSAAGGASVEAQLAQMQSRMIDDFIGLARTQQGYAATDGLFAIINRLGRLPGRKALILFSEGIAIPAAVHRLFLGVIDAANRANVTIYAMDAAGLRAESEQAKVRDRVNQTATRGIETAYSAEARGRPLTGALEGNEDALRQDPRTSLGSLARDTGGSFFDSTNSLREGFARIEDDLRNYYLLGYTPTNAAFDGRFRRIEVKVKRASVTVAARRGYFAVRNPGGMPINAWEARALGALEQKPVPNAFPVRAGALLFPERGRPGLVPIVVDFKTAPITFQPLADGKSYSSDFTVLVRFLDQQSQVTRQVSQHYEINGPVGDIERAKLGVVVFYRESELPPGVYSMEAIVYDALSGKSSVRFSTIEVPKEAEGALRISSVVLVKRAEKLPEKDRRTDSPLLVNDLILHPSLGDPVSKAAKEVAFYFAIYPGPDGPAPESSIELLQQGTLVARLPMPSPAADASGRIQHVGRLPLGQLAPGPYELRAVVKQGSEEVSRSVMLRITE
jgi:VWFA-related protein